MSSSKSTVYCAMSVVDIFLPIPATGSVVCVKLFVILTLDILLAVEVTDSIEVDGTQSDR